MSAVPGAADVAPLAGRGDAMRDLLVRLADIPSGSADPPGLARMHDELCVLLRRLPCEVRSVEVGPGGRRAIVASARPEAPVRALLSAHYDTVFGPEDGFSRAELLDADTLRGPGVVDMKGGIVVMLEALTALEASPYADGLGWHAVIVPDEETGSVGSAGVIAQAATAADVGLVFEPALPMGGIVRHRLGSGEMRLAAAGRAAHSGRDLAAGRNAVVALADAAMRAHALNEAMPDAIVNVAAVAGGGPANVVPDAAVLDLGVRAATAEAAAAVDAAVRGLAADVAAAHDVAVTVTGGFTRPPRRVDARWEALAAGYVAVAADLGVELGWGDAGGSSDGNLLTAAGLPALDGLGPRGGGMHSHEEHCVLSSLPERAAMAALFLMRLAGGAVPVP